MGGSVGTGSLGELVLVEVRGSWIVSSFLLELEFVYLIWESIHLYVNFPEVYSYHFVGIYVHLHVLML